VLCVLTHITGAVIDIMPEFTVLSSRVWVCDKGNILSPTFLGHNIICLMFCPSTTFRLIIRIPQKRSPDVYVAAYKGNLKSWR